MKIGVIGAGGIGQAFASQVAKAGYEVIVSNSRGPESLAEIAAHVEAHQARLNATPEMWP